MAEPLIELGPPSLGEREKQAVLEVIDSGWLTMGDRVRSFERAFAGLHEVDDAIAVSSATAALQLSLAAFDIGPGDEVLVPSLTFVATANVVAHAGATPVFVDVGSTAVPHIAMADAERRITPRTRAVIVMHYAGYAVDVAAWRAFCEAHGLVLIEDAAHAAGLVGGTGRDSDAAAFSFFANKNMTTAEGGMLLVADPDRRARARLMRSHGMTATTLDRTRGRAVGYDVVECGHNFRMDEIRGALGLVQLDRLPGWNTRRRRLSERYRDLVAEVVPEVAVPFDRGHPTTGHLLPVLLPDGARRPEIMSFLREAGVQSSVHYPPVHRFDHYRSRTPGVRLPETERFADAELTLPLHPRLGDDDVDRVVRTLRDALKETR